MYSHNQISQTKTYLGHVQTFSRKTLCLLMTATAETCIFSNNGDAKQLSCGEQGHVAPLATLSFEVLKRQRQITKQHKPKNIRPQPPSAVEREAGNGSE